MRTKNRLVAFLTTVVVAAAVLVGLPGPTPDAAAAEASLFDPGEIISDTVFYDSGAMTVSEVQTFLEQRGRNCVAGEQQCLKDYRTDSRSWASEAGLCLGYTGRSQETASQIIVGVAQSCGISPRVLLVLLEKEQALVGRTRPTSRAYQIAMGFGCPDTAPCNAEYYGFFNQTYRAARQFQIYQSNPTRYGYQAGRTNFIQWHPNASCGGSNVFIRNQATAALYIYTPYQPNAASLRNLYGTGDSCSSYGNRNFWRLFTDWFGDPRVGGTFVRTANDATVWLVDGANRYAVPSLATLNAYSRLGNVAFVSQDYLNRLQVGTPLGSMVLERSSGTVYFVDSNFALPMSTCGQVSDFGGSCSALPTLSAPQIARLMAGPAMTNAYETLDGRLWHVSGGVRREVLDAESLAAAGLSTTRNRLSWQGIGNLALGDPLVRDRVVIRERGTNTGWLWTEGRRHEISLTVVASQETLAGLPQGSLDTASVARLTPGLHVTGTVAGPDDRRYLLTTTGLSPLDSRTTFTSVAPRWSAALIASFPVTPPVAAVAAIKESDSSTIWRAEGNTARSFASWGDLVDVLGTSSPRIHTVPAGVMASLTRTAGDVIPAGILVKSPTSADVSFSTDVNTLVYLDSFAVSSAFGLAPGVRTVRDPAISTSARIPGLLSPLVTCRSSTYAVVAGQRLPVDVTAQSGLPRTPLGTVTCDRLPLTQGRANVPVFVKSPDAADLYFVQGQVRRPVQSWSGVYNLTGGAQPTILTVGRASLDVIPMGPVVP